MAKMLTIKHLAVGRTPLPRGDEARIERNLFAENGETFEALRFCKNRNGRHHRVHLVIPEADFAKLFRDAVQQGVFHPETLENLRQVLQRPGKRQGRRGHDPFADVIGIFADGTLSQNIDEELYRDPKK